MCTLTVALAALLKVPYNVKYTFPFIFIIANIHYLYLCNFGKNNLVDKSIYFHENTHFLLEGHFFGQALISIGLLTFQYFIWCEFH